MVQVFRILLFCLFFVLISCQTIYDDQNNPNIWRGTCLRGKSQSPINIIEKNSKVLKVLPYALFVRKYDEPIGEVRFFNSGNSIQVEFTTKSIKARLIFKGVIYKLIQFHFHWGNSEHSINDQLYDGEIHLVHESELDGSLLVVGALLKKTGKSNNKISELFKIGAKELREPNSERTIFLKSSVRNLLDNIDINKYFTYKGSLTTPNCDEGVTWFVLRDIVNVDAKAIKNLQKIKDNNGNPLIFNNRQIQPINGRTIYRTP